MALEATHGERRHLMFLAKRDGATLDGKPALISGSENDFATVWEITAPTHSAQFSWPAVRRIMAQSSAFNS